MKLIRYLALRSIVAGATIVFLSTTFLNGQTDQPAANVKFVAQDLNLLVLGDSILWGQGLKEEHKSWYLVKTWLQQTSGREVRSRVEAHAGAVIGSVENPSERSAMPLDGEISRAVPTLHDQIDLALKSYVDPARVDLIVVDGCINDVNARRLLNAANTPEGIHDLAGAKCGPPFEALLGRIISSFPNAHVVVTGYYPVISEKTPNDLFTRALAKRFYETEGVGTPRVSDKQLLARLIAISKEWYQASNRWLMHATAEVDAQLRARGSRQRVLFAEIPFLPEHSFAARESRLWGFDASALRKLLVVATLGRVTLKANDERRSQRSKICDELFKRPTIETDQQKGVRKDRLMVCRLASIGHPNRKGAVVYADAINQKVKLLIANPGWLRDRPLMATPANSIP